jgi:hypothetical protein
LAPRYALIIPALNEAETLGLMIPRRGMKRGLAFLALLAAVFSLASVLPAQDQPPDATTKTSELESSKTLDSFWTNRGHFTFGMQVGYAVEDAIPRNISHVNLLIFQPQVGLIAWDSPRSRLSLSRFEILPEGILGNAIHPGGRITGTALLFRLDGKPHRRLVPFFDFGAGVLNTTLNTRVPEINGHTQFTPQGGPGIQYFFKPQRALVIQYRYMHMSNASIQPPNRGFNANMMTIGFRWLRRPHP